MEDNDNKKKEDNQEFNKNNSNGYNPDGNDPFAENPNTQNYNNIQNVKKQEEYKWDFNQYQNLKEQNNSKKSKVKNRGIIVFSIIIGICLIAGIMAVGIIGITGLISSKNPVITDQQTTVEQKPSLKLNNKPYEEKTVSSDGVLTTEKITVKVSPSVVGIVNYQKSGNMFTSRAQEGSGIIMRQDGYIITNAHVVGGADGIKVVLSNGEELSAQIIGVDVETDLAVIKVDANNLTYAEFGNSDQVVVGEKAVAIGNPGGLQLAGSVTQGIISAKDRDVVNENGVKITCLQTDAAINPGNSGGPLVNKYGQVIGINSSKISATDYEGIGFAIPMNTVEPIVNNLIKFGYVKGRVKMGITLSPIDEILASLNNVPTGLFVEAVEPGSGGAKGGIVPGDIITHINNQRVKTSSEVKEILKQFKPNDKITLKIYRRTTGYGEKTLDIDVALSEITNNK